jgi:hypothetical protein
MADIFISYAREDKERVRPIVKELEKLGWSLFWDTKIQPGDNWPIEITEALKSSRCVVVLWSLASVDFKIHHWIRAEAEFGRKKGILVPLLLDEVEIPIEFSHLQAADLSGWKKNSSDSEFQNLVHAVTSKIISSAPPIITPTSKPAPAKTITSGSPNSKTERQQKVAGNEHSPVKINPKLTAAAVAVAVVITVIFLVVGLLGRKQLNIPDGPAPNAQSTPMPPDSAALRAKQKANDLMLRQAEGAKLNAQNEAVAARQEVARLKVEKKEADNRYKAVKETDSSKTQGHQLIDPNRVFGPPLSPDELGGTLHLIDPDR